MYVHLAGSFPKQLNSCKFSEEFVRVDVLSSFEERDECVVDYAAAWEANFIYDTIIFILTVVKTWKDRRGISGERLGLIQLMLRDGRSCLFPSYS